mmetsp:Transcript_18911/g.48088  ORF Transcript_18911/g.48088 Transcript_18911/m.48088 type:complete len:308 (+) Transcript_18911:947-1870(+)
MFSVGLCWTQEFAGSPLQMGDEVIPLGLFHTVVSVVELLAVHSQNRTQATKSVAVLSSLRNGGDVINVPVLVRQTHLLWRETQDLWIEIVVHSVGNQHQEIANLARLIIVHEIAQIWMTFTAKVGTETTARIARIGDSHSIACSHILEAQRLAVVIVHLAITNIHAEKCPFSVLLGNIILVIELSQHSTNNCGRSSIPNGVLVSENTSVGLAHSRDENTLNILGSMDFVQLFVCQLEKAFGRIECCLAWSWAPRTTVRQHEKGTVLVESCHVAITDRVSLSFLGCFRILGVGRYRTTTEYVSIRHMT